MTMTASVHTLVMTYGIGSMIAVLDIEMNSDCWLDSHRPQSTAVCSVPFGVGDGLDACVVRR